MGYLYSTMLRASHKSSDWRQWNTTKTSPLAGFGSMQTHETKCRNKPIETPTKFSIPFLAGIDSVPLDSVGWDCLTHGLPIRLQCRGTRLRSESLGKTSFLPMATARPAPRSRVAVSVVAPATPRPAPRSRVAVTTAPATARPAPGAREAFAGKVLLTAFIRSRLWSSRDFVQMARVRVCHDSKWASRRAPTVH